MRRPKRFETFTRREVLELLQDVKIELIDLFKSNEPTKQAIKTYFEDFEIRRISEYRKPK